MRAGRSVPIHHLSTDADTDSFPHRQLFGSTLVHLSTVFYPSPFLFEKSHWSPSDRDRDPDSMRVSVWTLFFPTVGMRTPPALILGQTELAPKAESAFFFF